MGQNEEGTGKSGGFKEKKKKLAGWREDGRACEAGMRSKGD